MPVGQDEMKSLGVFGIFIEAHKIISSSRKIFNQINLFFILPLSVIFLANIEVSDYLLAKIINNQNNIAETRINTPKYNKIARLLFSEYAAFLLVKAAYFLLTLVFSLLSTSAVVYTIARIHTGQEVTFSKVLRVVPKVWKRLILTFFTVFAVFVAYNIAAALLLISWIAFLGTWNIGLLILFFLIVFYVSGLVYMSIVWQLANTVSVLEDSYGFEAMKRSRQLIKGKVRVTVFIFLVLVFFHIAVQGAFQWLMVHGLPDMVSTVAFAIFCLCLHATLVLYGHVFHTIIYLVCKSYHNENVDKLTLSGHLEAYSDHQEYVPLKGQEDVEPGKLMV